MQGPGDPASGKDFLLDFSSMTGGSFFTAFSSSSSAPQVLEAALPRAQSLELYLSYLYQIYLYLIKCHEN